ncbi:MAG: poly(R)-hydroxyalkanoic acid synthase subunit PhaE [Dehalococcoidia bacterium]
MTTSNPPDFATAWRDSFEEWARAWAGYTQPAAEGEKPPPTPSEAWKRSMDRWLGAWATFLEESMNSPNFAATSGQTLNRMLDVQKPIRDQTEETMQRWLEAINVPSRSDFVRLARQLNDVNARLDAIADQIEGIQDALNER